MATRVGLFTGCLFWVVNPRVINPKKATRKQPNPVATHNTSDLPLVSFLQFFFTDTT